MMELLLIVLVALLAFKKEHLPDLVKGLTVLYRHFIQLKKVMSRLFTEQIEQQQLEDNIKKARQADDVYQQQSTER